MVVVAAVRVMPHVVVTHAVMAHHAMMALHVMVPHHMMMRDVVMTHPMMGVGHRRGGHSHCGNGSNDERKNSHNFSFPIGIAFRNWSRVPSQPLFKIGIHARFTAACGDNTPARHSFQKTQ